MWFVVNIFFWFLIAAWILSWITAFTRPPEWLYPVIRIVNKVTEPILVPFRRLVPPVRIGGMGLDVSFMFVFLIVLILRANIPH